MSQITLCSIVLLSFVFGVTSQIIIFKCCRNGEELSLSQNTNSDPVCKPSMASWEPLIYSPSQNSLSPKIPPEWIIQEEMKPTCLSDHILKVVPCTRYLPCIFWENGNAVSDIEKGTYFSPSEFCTDSQALLICTPKKVQNKTEITSRTNIYRCCGKNAIFDEDRHSCVIQPNNEDEKFLLPNISSNVEVVFGFPRCLHSENFTIVGDASKSHYLPNGDLQVNNLVLPSSQYCVEQIKQLDKRMKIFACSEYTSQRSKVTRMDVRFRIYAISLIISAIFLAATLATGWLLPSSHHVLHWRCQTYHVICLMLGDLLMAIIQLAGDSLQGNSCKLIGILAHVCFLAAFFWLNTMCFNIWWTFRDLRPATLEKSQETLRLRVYACYAWGGPLLIAGVAALFDHLPAENHYSFLKPKFGEKMCWFYGDTEILAYFYGPIGVLFLINVIFFIATTHELTCGLWKGEFVKSTTERAALSRVCFKLVIVMGVTWIADVISWAIGGPSYLWYFTDLINALQGVFIFIVVGWQPQVRSSLKRIFNGNPRTNAGRQGNGLSTTSNGMPSLGDSVTHNPSTRTVPLETIC
ncbi:probable G-protein coupled receptor Mth-like 1 [Chelonus insularis]|uniref:probable G-protein coupled receptor Mth-like 1 n=1 Tax=Chelonus insularis TaxID=460826 RepID=UPI00158A64B9|nr:probable G-protein coupled receptor Mth-like 1 [Chelonus insularis]